jgi:hypothetical protein
MHSVSGSRPAVLDSSMDADDAERLLSIIQPVFCWAVASLVVAFDRSSLLDFQDTSHHAKNRRIRATIKVWSRERSKAKALVFACLLRMGSCLHGTSMAIFIDAPRPMVLSTTFESSRVRHARRTRPTMDCGVADRNQPPLSPPSVLAAMADVLVRYSQDRGK